MAKPVSNVAIATDTFAGWITKTNILLDALTNEIVTVDSTSTGANVTGNGVVKGILAANTLKASSRVVGGSLDSVADLSPLVLGLTGSSSSNVNIQGNTANVTAVVLGVTSNTFISGANVSITGNFLYSTANVSVSSANVTIAGGRLTSTSNVSVSSANVYIDGGRATVVSNTVISGANVSVTGSQLYTTSNVSISSANNTIAGGTLTVTSNVSVSSANTYVDGGSATVKSNTTIEAATVATVSANNTLSGGKVTVSSNTIISGANASVTGSQLYVTSNVSVSAANTTIAGGSATVSSNVSLTGANAYITSNVYINSANATINSKTTIANTLAVQSTAYVNGSVIFGSSCSAIIQTTGNFKFPTNSTTANLVDSFALSEYNGAKYTIYATDASVAANNNYKIIAEISLVAGQDNTNTYTTQYGTIFTSTNFLTFTANTDGTNVRLYATSNGTVTNTYITILKSTFK